MSWVALFTTTEIKSEDVYEELFKWKDLFDFSNYSKNSKFFNETNKKIIGKMKDEFGGIIVDEVKNVFWIKVKNVFFKKKLMLKNQIMLKK